DFGCGIQQPFPLWILANGPHRRSCRKVSVDSLPTLTEVSGLERIWRPIVGLVPIDSNIRSASIEMSGLDEADAAVVQNRAWPHIREILGCDVRPVLSAIRCDVNQTIVAPGPDRSGLHRRFGDGKDCAVVLGAGVVLSDGAA